MSLWTPGGEHEVPREPAPQPRPPAEEFDLRDLQLDPETMAALDAMSPEERAQAEQMLLARAQQVAEQQAAIAQAPAAVVIANHAMGLFELAAIHLRQQPPNLAEAEVAIDALSALVDALKGRLGDDEATLNQALEQIRMAFVDLKSQPE